MSFTVRTNKQTSDELEEAYVDAPTLKSNTQYTFSSGSYYTFQLTAYVIQRFIKQQKHIIIQTMHTNEFAYEFNKSEEIISKGAIAFEYDSHLYVYKAEANVYTNSIKSTTDVSKLVDVLKNELKRNNPLRGKFLQLLEINDAHVPLIKKTPSITFKDVILDEQLKSDIYDNTLFQLEHLNESNGVILYGKPGVGKSHICGAITNEANQKGFTVCYLTTQTDYSMLNEFVEQFISPCILVFEDIDSFAESRLTHSNSGLADFLQFINGIGEREDKIIFIATTNYLEKLDEAISNRPMRFNRKFEFNFPNKVEMEKLITLYFNEEAATKYASKCLSSSFSGAHIKEVQRTAKLLAKKNNKTIDEVFEEAFYLVKTSFSTDLKPFGFNS